MFIVWGSRIIVKLAGTGMFFCIFCQQKRGYVHKVFRRWFTLYWIPLFPMATLGEHVECQTCEKVFEMAAISYDPGKIQAERLVRFNALTAQAAVMIARSAGPLDVAARGDIRNILSNTTGSDLADADLVALEGRQSASPADPAALYPQELVREFADSRKEQLLHVLLAVARLQGRTETTAQLDMMRQFGAAFGMSDAYVRGVLAG